VRDATGSHVYGFLFIALVMALGGGFILLVTSGQARRKP